MRAARCALLNFLQTERAGRSRLFFFLFLLSNLIAKILRLVHRLYKQEYDEGNNKEVMHALINAPKSISVPGRHQKNACETFKFYQSNRIC